MGLLVSNPWSGSWLFIKRTGKTMKKNIHHFLEDKHYCMALKLTTLMLHGVTDTINSKDKLTNLYSGD